MERRDSCEAGELRTVFAYILGKGSSLADARRPAAGRPRTLDGTTGSSRVTCRHPRSYGVAAHNYLTTGDVLIL